MAALQLTSNRTGSRLAAACFALLGLPFAAFSVAAFVWAALTLFDWRAANDWVEVPAELVSVELEEHDDDEGSTTYKTTATYRYHYAGQAYANDRVAIDTGADNVGDFQRQLYWELRAARDQRMPVTAYVDPENPAHAVLNRELRVGLLALKGVFALVFGAIAFSLLFGTRAARKKAAAERAVRERFPDEPWRWRPEWANGRITSSARSMAEVAIGFAVVWNLVSLPMLFVLPREIAGGNAAAAVGLLFPLSGVGLAVWAIRAGFQLRRIKDTILTLDRLPVAIGGRLKGTIRVEAVVPIATDFCLELACVESRASGRRWNRSRQERLLWQTQWRVPRHQCQIGASFTTIPVDAPVPAEQPATTTGHSPDEIEWRLDVTGECPGADFWSRFALPVFATQRELAPTERATAAAPMTRERPDTRTLHALGIRYERLPQGGEAWTFRRAQHKADAAAITAFAAMWALASGALFFVDAPLPLSIMSALFDAALVWWALSLWLVEYRVTLDRGLLTLSRHGFMARAPIEIPLEWIRGVRAKRGMQTGNKLYYDLTIDTADGSHTAASALADYDVASWLARHWMAGGTAVQR